MQIYGGLFLIIALLFLFLPQTDKYGTRQETRKSGRAFGNER